MAVPTLKFSKLNSNIPQENQSTITISTTSNTGPDNPQYAKTNSSTKRAAIIGIIGALEQKRQGGLGD